GAALLARDSRQAARFPGGDDRPGGETVSGGGIPPGGVDVAGGGEITEVGGIGARLPGSGRRRQGGGHLPWNRRGSRPIRRADPLRQGAGASGLGLREGRENGRGAASLPGGAALLGKRRLVVAGDRRGPKRRQAARSITPSRTSSAAWTRPKGALTWIPCTRS